MSDNNLEISNYAIHKQLFAQMEPLSGEKLDKKLESVKSWFNKQYNSNYVEFIMLMCKENSYYTVLHLNESNPLVIDSATKTLAELLEYRGHIIDITYNDLADAYECWVKEKNDGEIHMYYLFTYDWGIVEV